GDVSGYENTWEDGIERHKDEILQCVYEEGVRYIPDNAFRNYRNLQSVTFPDSLETIGYQDFMGCDSLTVLDIPRNVRSIGEHTFMCCEKLVNVNVDERNLYFASVDGVLYDKAVSKLLFYPIARTDTSYQVPDTVRVIRGPFYLYSGKDTPRCSLERIILPDHLERIENFAFQECRKLKEINIPDSVTYLGEGAFYHCEALEEAAVPKGITSLSATFAGCMNLHKIVIPGSVQEMWFAVNKDVMDTGLPYLTALGPIGGDYNIQIGWTEAIPARAFMRCDTLQSAVIPDGITSIGSQAFESCRSLSSITIPASLKTAEDHAFYDCEALKDIYYNGIPAQWAQIRVENDNNAFAEAKVHYKVDLSFNANGGTVTPSGKTVYTETPYGDLPVPVRDHYRFDGWYTAAEGGTRVTESTAVAQSTAHTLYAHWTRKTVYQVVYNAAGGTGTPSAQTKEEGTALTLSSEIPAKSFMVSYNAAGGNVTPASKNLSCTFISWNTARDGSGQVYAPGARYTADADAVLYARWQNPKAGDLAVPVRSGYVFDGWYTSASGGSRIYSDTVISADTTLYAHWREEEIYNLGDETYSFANYSDGDSNGHCFGMSVTSAGYYNGQLDIRDIGGNENTPLYSFRDTQRVRDPICYYQGVQGNYITKSIVAGGSFYLRHYRSDISADWPEAVDYVKKHDYDGTGLLQLIFWKGTSGHAVNFLRYENVNGQDRLYAYDNNFPNLEVYFYRDARGEVHEAPKQTIDGAIESVGLHDIRIFFAGAGGFDPAHVLYVQKDAARVQGFEYSYMAGGLNGAEYVMYEIPANVDRVTIIPSEDNADFIYMGTEYSFGRIEEDTY
ncbi:MAG: leucine-rich repeat protein, partial [Solobacterium sp.]|nr:leucine-rich repeat protein [Solobacterium sp.]